MDRAAHAHGGPLTVRGEAGRPAIGPARLAAVSLAIALALGLAALLAGRLAGPRGLTLTVVPEGGVPAPPPRVVGSIDLRDLRGDPSLPRGARRARWDGFWRVAEAGRYKVVAAGGGPIAVTVDGEPVLAGQREERMRGLVDVAAGGHAFSVEYEPLVGPDALHVRWARASEPLRDFAPGTLFTAAPTGAQIGWSRAERLLRVLALAALLAAALSVAAWAIRSPPSERARRVLRVAVPSLVVLYAGALRLETLVGRYAWEGPREAIAVQRFIERWHPGGLEWTPEVEITGGDPYHYAQRARGMSGFYDADAREPLFPSLTRLFLGPLGGRILAVHVASAVASTLLVLATYLLGATAFSRAVGLVAALALAIDRDALWWSVEGFRDDTFALFAILSAVALVRVLLRPDVRRGALAGVAGAAACLTRITSLSFLLPAGVLLLLGRGDEARARRRAVGVAALALVVLVGPFLLACTIAYGDPFYSVNFHTKFYRSRTGMAFQQSMGWLDYLRTGSPLGQQLATGLTGLTTYPFGNKWRGLAYVAPWLPAVLATSSLAGLALFLRTAVGRLLLVALASSLLPYAFTWNIPGGAEWRFTMHAYPFYLVAAGLALETAVRWAIASWRRRGAS